MQELSAATVLETLYFYALGHQNSFDVCWPKSSIAETIFEPMVERIKGAGGEVGTPGNISSMMLSCSSAETVVREHPLHHLPLYLRRFKVVS